MKRIIMLLVLISITTPRIFAQEVKYCPVSGLDHYALQQFIDQNKKVGVDILADVYPASEYDEIYSFLVLKKDDKAIVIVNFDNLSYIIGVHLILSKDKDRATYKYSKILFPSLYGSGDRLSLDDIEKIFGASIVPLTSKNLQIWGVILTD